MARNMRQFFQSGNLFSMYQSALSCRTGMTDRSQDELGGARPCRANLPVQIDLIVPFGSAAATADFCMFSSTPVATSMVT